MSLMLAGVIASALLAPAPPAEVTWTAWDAARKAAAASISALQVTFTGQGSAAADMHVDAATANRYWEVTIGAVSGNVPGVGVVREDYADWTGVTGYTSVGAVAYNADGSLDYWVAGGSASEITGLTTFATGDVLAVCLKNGALYFGKAAAGAVTWLDGCDPETETGAQVTGITGRYSPSVCAYSSGTRVMTANFGASAWAGAPPSYAIGWPHAPTLGAHTMYKGEDYSTATPVVTSAITTRVGSSFLVSRGGFASVDTTPTDNKSNTFSPVGDPAPYAGYSGTFDMRNFLALNGFGGSGHTVTLDNSAAPTREITMALVEILDGHNVHLEDFSYTYPATASTVTSGAVTTTGPALLVAVWSGDAGGLTHTAVPSAGWHVIDSFLNLPPNSAVQYAVAVRDVAEAGSYDVSWAQTPDQSSPLWVFAFQYGLPVPVPMTLVGDLPDAKAGVPYSASLTLAGDFTAPVTIDASAGTPPAWMSASVDGTDVPFSGTPSAPADATDWTVRATDSSDPPQVATSAQSVAVAAASWTTWDAANDTEYGISFSNGDLTATCAGDNKGTSALASCAVDVASAHHYYELHIDSIAGTTTFYAGFALDSWAKDGPPGTGYADPPNAFSVSSAGTMYLSQSNKGASGITFAVGDTMLMFLAAGGGVYIGRLRSGVESWATGHSPKVEGDTPNYTLPAGVWRPACGADASGSKSAVLTANFGASAWANTPPTGAVGWSG